MDDEIFRQKELDAKIARLRQRLKSAHNNDTIREITSVILGILDLLGDEL